MLNVPPTTRWTPVDLGDVEIHGVEWGHDHALTYGYHRPASDLVPFAARVRDDGEVAVFDMPARGSISSLYHAGMGHTVCFGESPAALYSLPGWSPTPEFLEVEDDFLDGTRTWMAGADGHDFYVTEWEDGRLTTGEAWHEDYPEGQGLRRHGDPRDLLVGSSDVVTLVAGLLSSGDEPPAVGLWTNGPDGGPGWPGGWERVGLDPAPDGFTQIRSSVIPTVAGHRDGRPLLFDQRSAVETVRCDAPDLLLDLAHPPGHRHLERDRRPEPRRGTSVVDQVRCRLATAPAAPGAARRWRGLHCLRPRVGGRERDVVATPPSDVVRCTDLPRSAPLVPTSGSSGCDTTSVKRRPRRTALDRLRLEYRQRATTPEGREVTIRARRKIDAAEADPMAGPLPLFIVVPWAAVREFRNHKTYRHRWIVEIFPRFEPDKATVIAETSKAEALDLVDQEVVRMDSASS